MPETESHETSPAAPGTPPEAPAVKVQDKRRIHLEELDRMQTEAAATAEPEGSGPRPGPSAGAPAPASPGEAPAGAKSGAASGHEAEVDRLTRELDAARKRVDELARAIMAGDREREAFKARLSREREQLLDVERGAVAVTLLEAIDQLDLCATHAEDSPLLRGVKLIRENLLKKAESTGIERVELTGQRFDPNLAEASDMELTPNESEDGKVLATVRGCYRLKGRVIRPGVVRVAKYVKAADA